MADKERSPHFPPLPDPWPRLRDFVPPLPPVDAGGEAPTTAGEGAAPQEPEAAAPEREQSRVQVSGRVGRDPTFWLTRSGVARAKFPLGTRDDPASDTTTWRDVHAFRRVAEQVRDTIKRGDAVEIIAYRELVEKPGTRGPRQIEELRAVVVKRRD